VSFAVETHMNRIADVLGLDPWELRLKNANRKGDTSGNGVTLKDPSTVPVTLAAAERIGVELPAEYRQMTPEPRAGDLLPEHLVDQQSRNGEDS
jgi:CO/xanthine dehydrogenase Mo-binding subunit